MSSRHLLSTTTIRTWVRLVAKPASDVASDQKMMPAHKIHRLSINCLSLIMPNTVAKTMYTTIMPVVGKLL